MKPFDLEAALRGESVVTINGIPVLELLYLKKRKKFPVLVLLPRMDTSDEYFVEDQYLYTCDQKGIASCNGIYDLFMSSETKKLWIAINKNISAIGNSHDTSLAYENKNNLNCAIGNNNWIIKEIEIEV